MKALVLHVRVWRFYVAQFLKRRMIYAVDFWAGLGATLTLQATNLLFLAVIFAKVPDLQGWKRDEVLFIYGLAIMSYGLFHAFFANVYQLGNTYIVEGNLDRVLLRPLDPLFQIYFERVEIEDVGETLLGGALIAWSAWKLHLPWTWAHYATLPLFVGCGVLIFLGVFTALSACSFWFVDRVGLLPPIYNMMTFGRYPVTIYSLPLRFVLSWIIPFAFVAFFPSTWFLGHGEFTAYVLLTPVVALSFFGIGYGLFRLGMRRYESAGS